MKVLFNVCHLNGHTLGIHRIKSQYHLVQQNEEFLVKVLLNSFHLNGHTLGSNQQTQKLPQPPCAAL